MSAPDDPRKFVGVCMACHNWQIDIRPGALSDVGGFQPSVWAMVEAYNEHLGDCPNAGGRIKFAGQWVEPPKMGSGNAADGTLGLHPLPRWWVTK